MRKRGQAALEFLMSYGWAMLLGLVAIGSLVFYFGWDTGAFVSDFCILGPGLYCKDVTGDEGSISLVVKNSMGKDLRRVWISSDLCLQESGEWNLDDGQEQRFGLSECDLQGQKMFDSDLFVNYQLEDSSIGHTRDGSARLALAEGDSQGGMGGSGNGTGGDGYHSDGATILLLNFNEGDGYNIYDSSPGSHHGIHRGNTRLLMHLDEGHGTDVYDESLNGNDGTLENFDNTLVLMHMDEGSGSGTITDFSGNNNHGTVNGVITGQEGISGNAVYFEGSDPNRIHVPNSASLVDDFFSFPSWSLELWLSPSLTGDSTQDVFCGRNSTIEYMPRLWISNWGEIGFSLRTLGVFETIAVTNTQPLEADTWSHIVLVNDGVNITIYEDGNEVVSGNMPNREDIDGEVNNYFFGECGWVAENRRFKGLMDEFAIYRGALTEGQIMEHFNSKVAQMHDNFVEGAYGDAVIFDDNDDFIQVIDDVSLDISDEITIAMWANIQSQEKNWERIVTKGGEWDRFLETDALGDNGIWARHGPAGFDVDGVWTPDEWIHIAYTSDASPLQTELFIDGDYKDGRPDTVLPVPPGNFKFGTIASGDSFNGLIDEFVVCSKVLSPNQIADLKNNGEAKFCDWVEGAYETALEFDGVDDIAEIPDSDDWDFEGKDITVELWFKAEPNQENWAKFLDHHSNANGGWYFGFLGTSGRLIFYHENKTSVPGSNPIHLQSPGTYDDGNWHHVAVTIDNTIKNASMYVDGKLEDNDGFYHELKDYAATVPLRIGSAYYGNFSGVLDDIRISNTVRY